MENLKTRLLELGIYGTYLSAFNSDEIDYLYNKEYVEIYYTQDKTKLESDLLGESITKIRDYKIVKENINLLNIRINFNVFKNHLKKYKFKGDYPFQIIDILLTADDFIKTTDIRERLKFDAKRIFYVTKKLNVHENLIRKRDNHFTLLKIKKEGLFESEYNNEEIFNKPDIPACLRTDIPLLDQIKTLINESQIGITTEDINRQFGISVRQALHYLNKIADLERNKYKYKEIFIGKIKRLLFYAEDEVGKKNQNEFKEDNSPKFVTIDDRVDALNKMLEDKKGFVISPESILQFRLFLKTKFTPCKKTLMSTALKAGHKIFSLTDKSESKTLIIHKDVSILSYLNDSEIKMPKFNNTIEEDFFNKFVMHSNFVLQDNLYKIKENQRIEIIYEYLLSKSKDNYLLIDKNFINEMNLKFLLQIVPVEIPNIIDEIIEQKNILEGNFNAKINLEDIENITRKELFSNKLFGKHSKIIKIQLMHKRILKIILKLEERGLIEKYVKNTAERSNLDNLNLSEFDRNTNLKIFHRTEDKNLILKILNEQILVKLTGDYKKVCEEISKKTKKNFHVKYEDRTKLYNIVISNSHEKAYKIIKKFIKKKYSDTYKNIHKIVENIFKNVEEEKETYIPNLNIQEFLYTKIKHDLLKNEKLDPKDYEKYDCVDLVLEKLRKDEIITSNEKDIILTNCTLRAKVRSRLEKKFEIVDFKYKMYSDRDTIYNMYFNFFYEILVKTGSLELSDILTRVNICKDFEFYNFLKAYKDVFEINEVENIKIVSVKIDIDPFDFI